MRGRSLVPTPSQSPYHTFQSITILGRGETPPRRGGIKQGGNCVHAATSCNWDGWRPWVLSMRRACMEDTQLESRSSKWLSLVRLEHTTTPRTRREPTRVAPDRIGSPKGSKPDLFR